MPISVWWNSDRPEFGPIYEHFAGQLERRPFRWWWRVLRRRQRWSNVRLVMDRRRATWQHAKQRKHDVLLAYAAQPQVPF